MPDADSPAASARRTARGAARTWCENRRCSEEKGLGGCYECSVSCEKGLLKKMKPQAFKAFVARYGAEELMDCLERNEKDGIVYHRDGITGDYDGFDDMETLIRFIREGKKP